MIKMKKIIILLLLIVNLLKGQSTPNYSVYGVFNLSQTQYYDAGSSLVTNNSVAAYLSPAPAETILFSDCDSAGTLQFNGDNLIYDHDSKFYSNNTVTTIVTKNWSVSGNNSMPAMNFAYTGSMPAFDLVTNLINDTLVKSDTLFITLSNIQHTDSISILFSDNLMGSSINRVLFRAPNHSNNYYVIPTVFSPLQTGTGAFIKIEAINYSYQTISGKQYLFRHIYSFARNNIIIVN